MMKNLARLGCLARAFVYFWVGVLALMVAMGNRSGAVTDETGVLRWIASGPFGFAILLAISAGLFSYAVWRFFQSVQDHDRYGRKPVGLLVRTAFFFSGAAH